MGGACLISKSAEPAKRASDEAKRASDEDAVVITLSEREQEKALGIGHAESMPAHCGQDMSAMAEDTK